MADLETITRFSDARIQAAIDSVTANLPPDKKGALVAHVDGTGASVTFVERVGANWTIRAGAYKPFNGVLVAEASVEASW